MSVARVIPDWVSTEVQVKEGDNIPHSTMLILIISNPPSRRVLFFQ